MNWINRTNIRTGVFQIIDFLVIFSVFHFFGFEIAILYGLAIIAGSAESEVWA